jgi:hypothetical protein
VKKQRDPRRAIRAGSDHGRRHGAAREGHGHSHGDSLRDRLDVETAIQLRETMKKMALDIRQRP